MTHSVSQWKIRLMSLMVAASVFTGGMATLAEPVSAKDKSHSKKSKKAKKKNNNHHKGNGNGGTSASTEVDKEIDQSAEQSGEQTNSNTQNPSSTQTAHNENTQFVVAPQVCPAVGGVGIGAIEVASNPAFTAPAGFGTAFATCVQTGPAEPPAQSATNSNTQSPTNTNAQTGANTNTPSADNSQNDTASNNSGAMSVED